MRVGYFPIQGQGAIKCEGYGMTIAVVLYAVALEKYLVNEVGVTCGAFRNTKERGLGGVALEHFEHVRRYVGIRAIIEGQSDIAVALATRWEA